MASKINAKAYTADTAVATVTAGQEQGEDISQSPVSDSAIVDKDFDVRARLANLEDWATRWQAKKQALDALLLPLNTNHTADGEYAHQLASVRRREHMILVKRPLELSKDLLEVESDDEKESAYEILRKHLAREFGKLSKKERVQWLTNFMLLLTPDMRAVMAKIQKTRSHDAFGQGRCFMLAAPSGMGKSTLLNYVVLLSRPGEANGYNRVPIAMIDAPVTNHTAKAIFRRLISEYGTVALKKFDEEDLINALCILIPRCKTELIIVDEVQHLRTHVIRRRLLEISNITTNVPILISSVNPERFADDDSEIAGRWSDIIRLKPYVGDQLADLLNFIELILPFPTDSNLMDTVLPGGEEGPATFIEKHTSGVLKRIMVLLVDAMAIAIEAGAANLSLDYIKRAASQRTILATDQVEFTQVLEDIQSKVA
jgi:energy-coupling factor transporter ATP-binding protein EcfA2